MLIFTLSTPTLPPSTSTPVHIYPIIIYPPNGNIYPYSTPFFCLKIPRNTPPIISTPLTSIPLLSTLLTSTSTTSPFLISSPVYHSLYRTRKIDPQGREYYIDKEKQRTQWRHPYDASGISVRKWNLIKSGEFSCTLPPVKGGGVSESSLGDVLNRTI